MLSQQTLDKAGLGSLLYAVIVTLSLDPEWRVQCPDPALKSPIEIYLGWDVFKSLGQNGCRAGGVIYCGSDLCCDRDLEN